MTEPFTVENCTFETLSQFNERAAEQRGYLRGLEEAGRIADANKVGVAGSQHDDCCAEISAKIWAARVHAETAPK